MKQAHRELMVPDIPTDIEYSLEQVDTEIRSLYGEILDRIIKNIIAHQQAFQYGRAHEQEAGVEYVPDPATIALEKSILANFAERTRSYVKAERMISELEAHLMNFSSEDDPTKVAESVNVYKEAILRLLSRNRKRLS